ncbi:hypothetical protein MASR2M117_23640 [Paludibacter sp.]
MLISINSNAIDEGALITVDKNGIMRYDKTNREASFYGVNYTLPFAHAYRAISYLGLNHKKAIDKDVYHFARLGFNAYRIHIWDVEISDSNGNFIQNEHLDLLDYLIFKLKERNIKIIITAMTNFGNGYPEKNINTGGFSYLYDKCEIHDNLLAQASQERYLTQLVKHINPYTKMSYCDDICIIGFEINNEPCHKGTQKQTQDYINRMVNTLKKAGNKKPVFYNVSHNLNQIEAYYKSNIQGTTFQWYPTGLVSGNMLEGNFLPHVDEYFIPFKNVKGYRNKAKLVYEYDPADILYGYIHPAIVRSFRTAGFQWITQFAYDPIDIAQYNTEYQTHYLNLAYTPQKAISLKIAAEAARTLPLFKSFGKYPQDTIFEDFRVSYKLNLSELNSTDKFYYSNNTDSKVKDINSLNSIAGCGNSTVVNYDGTGAYFLDKLESGIWRLEVMPDAVVLNDPFQKTSLKKDVVKIIWNEWDFTMFLPDFNNEFSIVGINDGNDCKKNCYAGLIPLIKPGVYILKKQGVVEKNQWDAKSKFNNIELGEFIAPKSNLKSCEIVHVPKNMIEKGDSLLINAQILCEKQPDSVIIYLDNISFWRSNNHYYKMNISKAFTYSASLPTSRFYNNCNYNIVVFTDGKSYTFPQRVEGNPLDWDFVESKYYNTKIVEPASPIILFSSDNNLNKMNVLMLPQWGEFHEVVIHATPYENSCVRFRVQSDADNSILYLQRNIKKIIQNRPQKLSNCEYICISTINSDINFDIGFVTEMGLTYKKSIRADSNIVKIPLSEFKQTQTVLTPRSYPEFMRKYFVPDIELPFDIKVADKLEISLNLTKGVSETLEIQNIWIE